jgi:hypothetical protein
LEEGADASGKERALIITLGHLLALGFVDDTLSGSRREKNRAGRRHSDAIEPKGVIPRNYPSVPARSREETVVWRLTWSSMSGRQFHG